MRNLKKVIALVAVFAMLVSTVAFAQSFTDVAEDQDYYEAIEMLSKLSILTGDDQDGDGAMDFRPSDTITRAEVAVIISRIQGINNAAQTNTNFTDVPSTHWASGYVAQAAGQGIVNGYGDGMFGPEDPVLYEQAVKMLIETIGYAPFVNDNGGYPTGYITAASRYGVLDGLVGGSIGAEASRGQVAQMVFNAVSVPLMDRSTYGANAEYVFYNGKNGYEYRTLLTQDLGVKKFSGVLTENAVTSLSDYKAIDTDDDEEIVIDADDNDDYYNYEVDEIETLYAGESGAADYIGKHVNVYVKETAKSGDYEILSIAESNKNKTVSFNLDQFDKVSGGYIYYYKNATDRTSTSVRVDSGAPLLLNGVATSRDFDELVYQDSAWGGSVTLIDNGTGNNYNVISVEIAATAVVDEISASGKVTFKNDPRGIDTKRIELDFDEDINEQIVKLTKNGAPASYEEIEEWTVLSVLANENNDYYVVDIIDAGKIEGTITSSKNSKTSAYSDGDETKQFRIDGKDYDVAENWYDNGKLKPGASGTFYIDNYGKIVAYDKNGTSSVSDKYGYIIAAQKTVDDFKNESVKVQLLDKTGAIYEVFLASKVAFENTAYAGVAGLADETVTIENIDTKALADALANRLVTYEMNSANEIKGITFAQTTDEDDNDITLVNDGAVEYDEDNQLIKVGSKKYEVDDNTIVFFITDDNDKLVTYADGTVTFNGTASKTASKVAGIAALSDEYVYGQAYDYDDTLGVVVLYNTKGGIANSSSIAVLESVGRGTLDGDTVNTVTFWMNGEQMVASVDPDCADSALANASKGDLFKFAVNSDGTIITEMRKVSSFNRYGNATGSIDPKTYAGAAGIATLSYTYKDEDGNNVTTLANLKNKEELYFGPVVGYASSNKTIRIAPVSGSAYDLSEFDSVKANNANVYVLDPSRKNGQIAVGVPGDVSYDNAVVKKAATTSFEGRDDGAAWVAAGEDAYGMMDFVAAFEYDGDILDVVIYRAYDFGKFKING